MKTKHRDPQREQFWRKAMSAWRASGLSVQQYCLRHELTESSFYFWRRELLRRDAQRTPTIAPEFVPVTVVPAGTLEIRCPSGHVVTLPTADATTLRMLFAALATEASC
jgi:transposase-like protein